MKKRLFTKQLNAYGDEDADHNEIEKFWGIAGLPNAIPFESTQTFSGIYEYLKAQTREAMMQVEYWGKKLKICKKMEQMYCLSESEPPKQVRAVSIGGGEPSVFMKPPLKDNVIIDAMQDASEHLLDRNHQRKVKNITWKDCHVLICLVYYVNAINIDVYPEFNNMSKLYAYCSNNGNFPTLMSERQYHGLYNQLMWADFGKYIANDTLDPGDVKLGKATIQQWKGFYIDASKIFSHYIYIYNKVGKSPF